MWERFTENAKRVVDTARDSAVRLGDEYVRPEHVLIGLCRVESCTGAKILDSLGVDRTALASGLERACATAAAKGAPDALKLSPGTKKAIELAVDHSARAFDSYIGTGHILSGVIEEGNGLASEALAKLHVDLERVEYMRRDLLRQEV